MGIPVFEEHSCPSCQDLSRLTHVVAAAHAHGLNDAHTWASHRLKELTPIAIDSPNLFLSHSERLLSPINNLTSLSVPPHIAKRFRSEHADTAIWHFYELMYLSYPPSDILRSVSSAVPLEDENNHASEYERYRWAALEWCIRNWQRIVADGARERFLDVCRAELSRNSPLIEMLLDGLARHYTDSKVITYIFYCIDALAALEQMRCGSPEVDTDERISRTIRLNCGLNLFLLNIPEQDLKDVALELNTNQHCKLLEHLQKHAQQFRGLASSFISQMHLRFTQPNRAVDPRWALRAIAESLCRGRDPDKISAGSHQLLPSLLKDVRDVANHRENRVLLQGCLGLFLAGLSDLMSYTDISISLSATRLIQNGRAILDWLKIPSEKPEALVTPNELGYLSDDLELDATFCLEFGKIFHECVERLEAPLQERARAKTQDRVKLRFVVLETAKTCRVLTHVQRLCLLLSNYAIDPGANRHTTHASGIIVSRLAGSNGTVRLCFRLLTNFDTLEETRKKVSAGHGLPTEDSVDTLFGMEISNWTKPEMTELDDGYLAACEITVPAGFVPPH